MNEYTPRGSLNYYRRLPNGVVENQFFNGDHHPFFASPKDYTYAQLRAAALECINKWNRQTQRQIVEKGNERACKAFTFWID